MKPGDEVRNLFDKKTYHKNGDDDDGSKSPSSPQLQNINSHRQPYNDFDYDLANDEDLKKKQKKLSSVVLRYDDENVQQAIELRNQKQKHTDFFFKLAELKERIEVYNEVFRSKKPRFLHNDAKLIQQRLKERELQRLAELNQLEGGVNGTPGDQNQNGKFSKQRSSIMKDPVPRKSRKSVLQTLPDHHTPKIKLNDQQHLENIKNQQSNIPELQEEDEQTSPTNRQQQNSALEKQDTIDSQKQQLLNVSDMNIRAGSAHSKSSSRIQQKTQDLTLQNDIQIPNDKTQLPKIAITQNRLNSQHKQSMEKAIENQRKQDQQTSSRLNAIEKKMPPVSSNISNTLPNQKNSKFNTLYNNNHLQQSRTNLGGSISGVTSGVPSQNNTEVGLNGNGSIINNAAGFNRFVNQSQTIQYGKDNNGFLGRNKSQNNMKLYSQNQNETDKNAYADPQKQSTKESKTLLQSQSYADFKSSYKRDNHPGASTLGSLSVNQSSKNLSGLGPATLAMGSPNKNVGSSKDRSILMKSIYETNLFKEQFMMMSSGQMTQANVKKGAFNGLNGPFNNGSFHQKKKKFRSRSPNPEDYTTVKEDTNETVEEGAVQSNQQQSPKSKKLPPVTLQSKSSIPPNLGLSQSSPYFVNPQMNDTKIKQISMLYNQSTNSAFAQNLTSQSSNQQLFNKMKKAKNKKKGLKKSNQGRESSQDQQNLSAADQKTDDDIKDQQAQMIDN